MNCIDLNMNTIKILGMHFSYNKNVLNDKNFITSISSIEDVLKLWRMRNLTLEGKIIIIKSLALSLENRL